MKMKFNRKLNEAIFDDRKNIDIEIDYGGKRPHIFHKANIDDIAWIIAANYEPGNKIKLVDTDSGDVVELSEDDYKIIDLAIPHRLFSSQEEEQAVKKLLPLLAKKFESGMMDDYNDQKFIELRYPDDEDIDKLLQRVHKRGYVNLYIDNKEVEVREEIGSDGKPYICIWSPIHGFILYYGTQDEARECIKDIEKYINKVLDERDNYRRQALPKLWKMYKNDEWTTDYEGEIYIDDFFSDYYKDVFGHRPRSAEQIEREIKELSNYLGVTLDESIKSCNKNFHIRESFEKEQIINWGLLESNIYDILKKSTDYDVEIIEDKNSPTTSAKLYAYGDNQSNSELFVAKLKFYESFNNDEFIEVLCGGDKATVRSPKELAELVIKWCDEEMKNFNESKKSCKRRLKEEFSITYYDLKDPETGDPYNFLLKEERVKDFLFDKYYEENKDIASIENFNLWVKANGGLEKLLKKYYSDAKEYFYDIAKKDYLNYYGLSESKKSCKRKLKETREDSANVYGDTFHAPEYPYEFDTKDYHYYIDRKSGYAYAIEKERDITFPLTRAEYIKKYKETVENKLPIKEARYIPTGDELDDEIDVDENPWKDDREDWLGKRYWEKSLDEPVSKDDTDEMVLSKYRHFFKGKRKYHDAYMKFYEWS